jgi:hypothetical protein
MPDEEKTEKAETAAERAEEAVEAVSTRAAALKKAGLPTAVILLITVMSFPGVWEFFFNRTDDEAKVKAEVSYALLKAQTEALAAQVKENRDEARELRDLVTQLLMQRSGRATMTDLRLPPAPSPAPLLKPLPANLDGAAEAAMERAE